MLGVNRSVFTRTLRLGATGEDVRQLQELLRQAGYDPGPSDGMFGKKVRAAVLAFQRAKGLQADGAVGPLTMAALSSAVVEGPAAEGHAAQGLSLHIGLNRVDPGAYPFQVPELAGCVNDANDMQELARKKGFRHRQLIDAAATSSAVVTSIEEAAEALRAGDIFWLTYSGHGSQVPDPEEEDQRSETWVLWDRQLIDNELYGLWGRFHPGVRVMICSDSCHSGTVSRRIAEITAELARATEAARAGTSEHVTLTPTLAIDLAFGLVDVIAPHLPGASPVARLDRARVVAQQVIHGLGADRGDREVHDPAVPQARLLDPSLAALDVAERAPEYRRAVADRSATAAPTCSVLLIAACQDSQTASDGRPDPQGHQNGAFTRALREVWETAANYADLKDRILRSMASPTQTPNLYWATPRNAAFEAQSPFAI